MTKFRPWIVWGSAGLFSTFQFLLQGSPSVMIPALMKAFSTDIVSAGLLTTYFFYTYIFMQVPSGALLDLFGPRILLLIGSFSASSACIVFSCCDRLWIAKGSRMLMGLTCAPGFISTLCLASRWFGTARFAFIAGLTETLAMCGAGIGMIILAAGVLLFGWRTAIFLCGALGYLLFLLIYLYVKNHPDGEVNNKTSSFSLTEELRSMKEVLMNFQVWVNALFAALVFSAVAALMALWGIPFFMFRYHISSSSAAGIVSLGFIGAGIGGPLVGSISNKMRRRKVVMIAAVLLSLASILTIIYISLPIHLMYVLTFLLGLACSSYVLPFAAVNEISSPQARGKAMGFTNMLALIIGAPILQPLIGSLLKKQTFLDRMAPSHFSAALLPIAFALLIALFLTFFIRENYSGSEDES